MVFRKHGEELQRAPIPDGLDGDIEKRGNIVTLRSMTKTDRRCLKSYCDIVLEAVV